MERQLQIEGGVPVAATAAGDGDVLAVVLGRSPRSARRRHRCAVGLGGAEEPGMGHDGYGRGPEVGLPLEVYKTHPSEEPDMDRWETELAFRLAD
jgi:hypothetical protein